MKKYILLSIAFVILISIFSIEVIAQESSDVQVVIKMRNLGADRSTGGTKSNITIALDKIGTLVYVEEYYSGSYEQPNYCCSSRYETIMKDYLVSFDLGRPASDHWQRWSLVKSKILLDKVIIYEEWTGRGGTYRSGSTKNNSSSSEKITSVSPKITEQVDNTYVYNNTNDKVIENVIQMYNDTLNDTKPERTTREVPSIGIPVIIMVILSVYLFKRMNK